MTQQQNFAHHLISKSFWGYLFTILTAPVGYLIKLTISRQLEVGDIGLFYSILGLIGLLSAYNDLGLTESLQYFLPRYRTSKQFQKGKTMIVFTLVAQLFFGLLVALALWFGAPWLALHFYETEQAVTLLRIFCLYFIAINIYQVLSSIFFSFQNVFVNGLIEMLRMRSVLGFTLLWLMWGSLDVYNFARARLGGLAIGIIVASIAFWLTYAKDLSVYRTLFEQQEIKIWRKYALWVFLGANVGSLFGQIDMQLIVLRLGTEAAGYFSNRSSLMQIHTIVLGPVLALVFPITSQLLAQGDQQKYQLYQKILFKGVFLVSIPLGVMFVSFGPSVAQILFGDAFILSGQLAQISGRFIRANLIVAVCFGFFAGNGMVMQRVKLLAAVVCLNVLMSFVFVKVLGLGLTGFIVSVSLTWIILSVVSLYLLGFLSIFVQEKLFFFLNALILVIGAWGGYWIGDYFLHFGLITKIIVAVIYLLSIVSTILIVNRSLFRALWHEVKARTGR